MTNIPDGFKTEKYAIFPYARGMHAPTFMYHVYQAMEHDLERVFYDMEHRDLEGVLEYFQHTVLFTVFSPDLAKILGLVWFTDVKPYKGNIGIWYAQEARGSISKDATNAVCAFVLEQYSWKDIFGFTPWKEAVKHGKDTGFEHVGTFPDTVCLRGMWKPLYVMRRKRYVGG